MEAADVKQSWMPAEKQAAEQRGRDLSVIYLKSGFNWVAGVINLAVPEWVFGINDMFLPVDWFYAALLPFLQNPRRGLGKCTEEPLKL